ncbi:MAG: Uma2 family endonuclease [Lachnospiraceae bacterium]|nr:Uma2 family endonuclease [Lachnospiraceae bacterium]
MTIEEMKKKKTEFGLTAEMISQASGVPLSTIQKIFGGTTKAPRKDTLDAIAKVLHDEEEKHRNTYEFYKTPSPASVCEATAAYGAAQKPGKYTLEDYYALPDEKRVELIDGVFYDMAAPSREHQMILGDMHLLFRECADLHDMPCQVILSPFDVRLDKDNYTILQPDLVVACHDDDENNIRYEGAPDLLVEILSPSTRKKDMLLKLYKYQNAGVREYWIVDPKFHVVTVHYFDCEDYCPVTYPFESEIPVRISEGKCVIDFSRVGKRPWK